MTQDSFTAAAAPSAADDRTTPSLHLVKGFGAVLLFMTVTPLFRLLDGDVTGQAGRAALELAAGYYDLMWSGLLLVAPIAVAAGFFTRSFDLAAVFNRGFSAISRLNANRWAILLALSTFVLVTVFTIIVMHGRPYHIDAIAQLLHARFWAEGALAGPVANGAFWTVQNSLFTPNGWVSQYPPGHVAVLAVAAAAGAAWMAGPLLAALLVYASARTAEQLLRDDPAAARVGSALIALSPFVVFLSGSFMNHITAAAFLALAAFLLTRESAGYPAWLGAGAALGVAFATRPLTALAMGAVYVFAIPFVIAAGEGAGQRLRRSMPWVLIGAAVPTAGLFAYNAHFFGSPFTFGYDIALGTAGKPGFGLDPWGNRYDAAAALGYTAMDVLALGTHLLESPLPPLLLVATALLTMRSASSGVRLLIGTVTAVLVANLFYWHHGLYMGPRMLFEAAPAWLLLFAVSVVHVARRLPGHADARFSIRNAFIGAVAASVLLGIFGFAPQRARGYAAPATAASVEAAVQTPAIVFVHETWRSRLAMRLAATGMRLDSIETVLRQNATCDVQHYADARDADAVRAADLAGTLNFEPRATNLPAVVEVAPGVRIVGGIEMVTSGVCAAELRSDFGGVQDLASLLASGDLPGSPARGILFVRDLGPERNRVVLSQHGDRAAYTMTTDSAGKPRLLAYEAGVRLMWRDSSALQMERQ